MTFRFSNNGIPSFACSAKPLPFNSLAIPQDFLWSEMPLPFRGEAHSAWRARLRYAAEVERMRWRDVVDAMARFACLVKVVSCDNAQWQVVQPGDYDIAERRGQVPKAAGDHGSHGAKTSDAEEADFGARPRSKVVGARTSSLRHEVRFD